MAKRMLEMKVNGQRHEIEVAPNRLLADLIRDDLHLTGTKRGCETGICGACSVLADGEVIKSCLGLAVQWQSKDITTVEGLASETSLHPMQQAFIDHAGLQCGYCTPGMMIAACALLKHNPAPTRDEVRLALSGNLCRCTGYGSIVDSIMAAAEKMRDR